jgi:hypothetical protein
MLKNFFFVIDSTYKYGIEFVLGITLQLSLILAGSASGLPMNTN